jgi:hypothetical protein
LLARPVVGDNAAVEAEPNKADPPKRKRRWFQFSLRTLLFVVVPYIAVYALVLCSILSHPKPVGTAGNLLYDLRMAKWEFGEAIGAGIARNIALIFTAIWILLPVLSWAIWRSASRFCRWMRGAAAQP